MSTIDINGKVALVTGANRGIGKAITETLLENGVSKVYAAVRKPESAQPLIDKYGDQVEAIRFDLTDEASIKAAAGTASDTQIVIANAGVLRTSSALDDDAIDSIEFEMNSNVYGLMRIARAFAPVLKANGGGALVQLNSVVSVKTFPDMATYCASKAASYAITQALRAQLGEQGTAVFSVHPGPIATDMGSQAGLDDVAEPPSLVANAILKAFKTGEFHIWPDSMAKQIGDAYQSFAQNVVEAEMAEA
ncbi:MAG: SDR family oxidoreductase [Phycisphaera sp.]|nr:MAG: SDR family oxidoreductase [Phycisphaera sp.]